MPFTRLSLRAVLPALAVLLLLTIGATSTGRTAPALDYRHTIPGFSTCDLPCWAGIVPLHTDYGRVRESLVMGLAGMNVTARDYIGRTSFSATGAGIYELSGTIYENRGRVGDMRIDVALPLWFLLQRLGTPACIATDPMSTDQATATLHWAGPDVYIAALVVVNRQTPWQPHTATRAIYVLTSDDVCQRSGVFPWQGFAPLWFYGLTTARQ